MRLGNNNFFLEGLSYFTLSKIKNISNNQENKLNLFSTAQPKNENNSIFFSSNNNLIKHLNFLNIMIKKFE